MKENLKLVMGILYKSFFIGLLILVLSGMLFIFKLDALAEIANKFYGIEKESYIFAGMLIMGMAKNILFFFFLCPALAIQMTLCCCRCKTEEK